MGGECCSGRYSEVDNQISHFWEHSPIRKKTIVEYTDILRSADRKVDISGKDNFMQFIVKPLLTAGEGE
jgi:hypothetical protein